MNNKRKMKKKKEMLLFQYSLSMKGSCAGSMVLRVEMLGGGGTFLKRWSLV
jgi:hypothetical protein